MFFSLKKWRLKPITHVQMCFSSSCFQCSALLHNNTKDAFDKKREFWLFRSFELNFLSLMKSIALNIHLIWSTFLIFCCDYGNGHGYWIRTLINWTKCNKQKKKKKKEGITRYPQNNKINDINYFIQTKNPTTWWSADHHLKTSKLHIFIK